MDGGPVVMRVPVKRVTVRVNGTDVQGVQFIDFWRAEYGDGEMHTISNPIREWLHVSNPVAIPDIVFVLEAGQSPDEAAPAADPQAPTHGDIYNQLG